MAMAQREVVDVLFGEQLEHCKQLSRLYPRDVVVSKALRSAEKALAQMKSLAPVWDQSSVPAVKDALQTYTQSVLDSTYHCECQLVEGGFPDDITRNAIATILGSFCKAVSLCGPMEKIQTTLGTDQWECINWRIGALMYMYIHELMTSDDRRATVDQHFIQECCAVGVCHLELMLSARAPLHPSENYTSHDDAVPQLLQEGIFSDVHMLALMYAGELCYWAWEMRCGSQNDEDGRVEKKVEEGERSELEEGERSEMEEGKRSELEEGERSELEEGERSEMEKGGRSEMEKGGRSEMEEGEGGSESAQSKRQENDCAAKDRETGVDEKTAHGAELLPPPPFFSSLLSQMKGVDYVQHYCNNFSPTDSGRSLLGRYVMLAQGPLKNQSWNYERAVELLEVLKT